MIQVLKSDHPQVKLTKELSHQSHGVAKSSSRLNDPVLTDLAKLLVPNDQIIYLHGKKLFEERFLRQTKNHSQEEARVPEGGQQEELWKKPEYSVQYQEEEGE